VHEIKPKHIIAIIGTIKPIILKVILTVLIDRLQFLIKKSADTADNI
jgi:hypothetical protein